MPRRLCPQTIGNRRKILRMAGRFGQRAVFGRNLVQRRRHQRFIDKPDGGRVRAFDAGNHSIEVIERSNQDLPRDAALGGVRIDVIEAFEIDRIFDVAEQRQRVAPERLAGSGLRVSRVGRGNACRNSQAWGDGGEGAALQKMSSGNCQMKHSCRSQRHQLSTH